jgi:Signal transduction histidine kinase
MTEKETVPIWSLLAPEHAEAVKGLFLNELERQKLDALAEFAAGVGHEINNPLAVIGGRAQILLREIDHEEHRKHLASILAQVRRAYEMIADIRLFARPPKPEPSETDIAAVLNSVVTKCSDATYDTEIVWDVHNVANDVRLCIDSSFLETILTALCKNAVEATGTQGQIKISCEYCPSGVIIQIEDNGPGIPLEHIPLLFSPYFSGRQAGRGLGFGLCKASRLLELMGGTIKFENRTPHGAKFVVTLREMPRD